MRTIFLVIFGVGCGSTREPVGVETQMAPTAAALARVAIKPKPVDRSAERWEVSRALGGWLLSYTYDHEGLSIEWHASYHRGGAGGFVPTSVFGHSLKPGENVSRAPVEAPTWGDATCEVVQASELDIGFECHGRNGDHTFAARVYGVSPHGAGAPAAALAGPLRALDLWTPANSD